MTQPKPDSLPNAGTSSSLASELEANFARLNKIMRGFVSSHSELGMDPFNLAQVYSSWFAAAMKNPHKVAEANVKFWNDAMQLYHQTAFGLFGKGANLEPVVQEHHTDRRFRHEAWAEAPVFDAIKQSYLLTSQWMRGLVKDIEGLDEKEAQKIEFFTERFLDAMAVRVSPRILAGPPAVRHHRMPFPCEKIAQYGEIFAFRLTASCIGHR
jgi:polyhydroxyalkanoate synthase